ncbi:MAG: hypothetical protein PHU18_05595 [Dehalococcoidales bacterium]|nr:hypothetical protein [Dehalococcoidales bacterium]
MSLDNFLQLLVAAGTISLALATFLTLAQNYQQLQLLKKQLLLQTNQYSPDLAIITFEIKGNVMSIELENIGSSHATWVGIGCSFYLVSLSYYSDKSGKKEVSELTAARSNEQLYIKFNLDYQSTLKNEEYIIYPARYINFLLAESQEPTILPNKKYQLSTELNFYIKEKKELGSAQMLDFNKLKELMGQNNRRYIAADLSLCYKDKSRNTMYKAIDKFIIDFEADDTLEQAWKKHRSYSFVALSTNEIFSKVKGMDFDTYSNVLFNSIND